MENLKLTKAWVEFLGNDWSIWFSATFRTPTPLPTAKKSFKHFFKYLNVPGKTKFYDRYMFCWVFFEKDQNRRGVHLHALLQGINPALTSELEELTQRYFGKFSKVVPYVPLKGANSYLALKINKTVEDYDFYKINSKFRDG